MRKMLLTDISKHINCEKIYDLKENKLRFYNIFSNSKNNNKNSIFFIDKKVRLKKLYIEESIKNGAIAIITNSYIKNINIPQFLVKDIENSIYKLLNKLKPNKPLNSLAVTGTNGKTSVVSYVSQICFYNKMPCKANGTLGYYINNKKRNDFSLTTPESEILYQTAFSKRRNLYNYVFEASSHAIDQRRLKYLSVNIAAITNISKDHLDYHQNFNNYKKIKYKLFLNELNKYGYAILNNNIVGIDKLKKKLINKNIITYGNNKSNINISKKINGYTLKFFNKKLILNFNSLSRIEIENLSCAIACCFCLDLEISQILKGLKNIINPSGRLENIYDKEFKIFIDYAHTPDALKKILIDKKNRNKKPNIVFGCGGNRDSSKRSVMGEIANKYANKVYITDDNPRDENPSKIRKTILLKCKKGIEIPDRKKAIYQAIKELKKNETLIIAGKGHEKIQIYNKNKYKKFVDAEIAKKILKKKIVNE